MISETEKQRYKKVLRDVKAGDSDAETDLAWFLLTGSGGAKVDPDQAVVLLEERVKDDDYEAMWMLGICYEFGLGTEKRVRKAKALYERSSEINSDISITLLSKKRKTCCLVINCLLLKCHHHHQQELFYVLQIYTLMNIY